MGRIVFVDGVRIERILGHRDAIFLAGWQAGGQFVPGIPLGQRILAPDAPPLTDIKMMRPIAVIDKFILRKAPPQRFVANRGRHFGIVLQQPQQPLVVIPIAGEDSGPLFGRRLRPAPILLGQIERFAGHARVGMGVVAVGFEISPWHRIELNRLIEPRDFSRGDVGQQRAVIVAVEGRRFFDRRAAGLVLGQVQAKAKGLDAVVRFACRAGERILIAEAHINPSGVLFAERLPAFAAHPIGRPGQRRQIAFVRGIDKHAAANLGRLAAGRQILQRHGDQFAGGPEIVGRPAIDPPPRGRRPLDAIGPDDACGSDAALGEQPDRFLAGQHLAKNLFGQLGLEAIAILAEPDFLGIAAVDLGVMLAHPPLELAEQPTDGRLFADVGVRQSAGDDSADVPAFFQHDHAGPRACCRHRRGDPGRRGADDNDVGRLRLGGGRSSENQRSEQKRNGQARSHAWPV